MVKFWFTGWPRKGVPWWRNIFELLFELTRLSVTSCINPSSLTFSCPRVSGRCLKLWSAQAYSASQNKGSRNKGSRIVKCQPESGNFWWKNKQTKQNKKLRRFHLKNRLVECTGMIHVLQPQAGRMILCVCLQPLACRIKLMRWVVLLPCHHQKNPPALKVTK